MSERSSSSRIKPTLSGSKGLRERRERERVNVRKTERRDKKREREKLEVERGKAYSISRRQKCDTIARIKIKKATIGTPYTK